MSEPTPTGRLRNKALSTSPVDPVDEDIVELRPPAVTGWPSTAKFSKSADASMIEELIRRGYTVVKAAEKSGE